MSFVSGFQILRAGRPGWDLTAEQAAVWAALLSDLPASALEQGAAKLAQETEFPYTVAGWRKCALAFVGRNDSACVDRAWDDMRRNRAIEMQLVYEQREAVIEAKRARITWSSEASRRAADYIGWRDSSWQAEDMNTLRAQHRGAYLSIVEKQAAIDSANDVRAIEPNVRRALGGGTNLLSGGT